VTQAGDQTSIEAGRMSTPVAGTVGQAHLALGLRLPLAAPGDRRPAILHRVTAVLADRTGLEPGRLRQQCGQQVPVTCLA
jgi:hypothetical protein